MKQASVPSASATPVATSPRTSSRSSDELTAAIVSVSSRRCRSEASITESLRVVRAFLNTRLIRFRREPRSHDRLLGSRRPRADRRKGRGPMYGRVEDVPDALAVRSGFLSRRRRLVPAETIVDIDDRSRVVGLGVEREAIRSFL